MRDPEGEKPLMSSKVRLVGGGGGLYPRGTGDP